MQKILTIDLDYARTFEQKLKIIDIFCKILKTNSKIYFIQQHHAALPFIAGDTHLYNIDHHHDIGYSDSPYQHLLQTKNVREGNWILHSIMNGDIKRYTWIANMDSDFKNHHVSEPIRKLEYFKKTFNLSEINDLVFEKTIICESHDYDQSTPFLFEILKTIYINQKKEFKKINISNEYAELIFDK
jgi:hypothetical protein